MSSKLKYLAVAGALALATALLPVTASAQFTGPQYQTDMKNSSGRDLDNLKDQVNGYNNSINGTGKYVEISPEAQVAQMGAGMNVVAGWDPYWTGGSTTFKLSMINKIRDAGFKTVRIPITTFKHMDTQGHLDPALLKKLDDVIEAALRAKLNVIIDEHDYDDCPKNVDACAVILPNVWYELSTHYKNAPNSVMFELLNEPHGAVDDQIWNSWLTGLVGIVRETNPTRNIIIGPVGWNSLDQLSKLKLPADNHIIVTFHYYTPMEFTHQGASWAGPDLQKLSGVRWTGTSDQVAKINSDFDKVAAWAKANNRPILLGEYGTYGKVNTNMDDRAAWTKAVSKAADDRGFARAYWYFEDGDGFGAWDAGKGDWNKPILESLKK